MGGPEGVEGPHQRDVLVELGCDLLQGYLFSRPLPAEGMAAYLAEHLKSAPPGDLWPRLDAFSSRPVEFGSK